MSAPSPEAGARVAHPAVYALLNVPFGAMSGYLGVTIAYLLSQGHVSAEEIAAVVALSYVPHTWKFAWAPLVDTTMTRKRWYVLGALLSSIGFAAMGAVPADAASLSLLAVVVLVANVGNTFVCMGAESLMAYATDERRKGQAAGWYQAGNLGGYGVGGGAALWLAQDLPQPWMAGACLGVACILCCVALLFVPEFRRAHRLPGIAANLLEVGRDLWAVARSRRGFLGLLICFLPIGSGAAGNLWAALADDWHATVQTVELVTGVANGVVSGIGCVVGGYLCDRMDRKTSYALYGVLQAMCAVAMALAPRTEAMYIVFTLAYALITGLTYAGFSAVVLEAIGRGAAATKYNVYASLSNIPIAYMTVIDGWARTRWNEGAMLYTEAAIGIAALLLFVAVATNARRLARLAQ
jgi:MFS family permease